MGFQYKKIHWTEHSKLKMRQYGLSKIKLIQLLSKPERIEEGIAPGTTALMRTNKSFSASPKKYPKHAGETWIMYKDSKGMRKIISAWKYPGISKPGENIPMPEDIKEELLKLQ